MRSAEGLAVALGLAFLEGLLATIKSLLSRGASIFHGTPAVGLEVVFLGGVAHLLVAGQAVVLI